MDAEHEKILGLVRGNPGITLNNLTKSFPKPIINCVKQLINEGKITALKGKIVDFDVYYLFPGNDYQLFQGI